MGRLEVICGPMFSGKSEELIRRLTRAKIAGKQVDAYKHRFDNARFGAQITAHSGATFNCDEAQLDGSRISTFGKGYDVVGIDEIQFFEEGIIRNLLMLVDDGTIVIVSGLDMTYRKEPFGVMPYLLAIADRVDKLTAVCHRCGEDAIYTQRLIGDKPAPFDEPTVVVGAEDRYEARCRQCYQPGL